MFSSFGFQTAAGSVQDYIRTNQLAVHSIREIGWITAILVFLAFFLGVQAGPLFDPYGHWLYRRRALASGLCMVPCDRLRSARLLRRRCHPDAGTTVD
ncbi:hypothetical protein ETB97_009732 [Aspergillus alliaceus]|uniref:Uncharacterized protein n=1 Tax=Petromyces alliaceus TaxID=209559 RepID=A0A8H6E1G2_PETAA|nr:hypothetical protein ETB97_009732 [Aspergillus burnettii]